MYRYITTLGVSSVLATLMPKSASGYLEHYFFSLMRAVKQSMILKSSLILEQDELKADFNLLTEDQLQIVKKKCIIIKK